MTSYPSSAREWQRRRDERMTPRAWVVAALVLTTIFAVAWLMGAFAP